MTKDPEKLKAASKRYRERQKIAKFGAEAAGVDMRGRHRNQRTGSAHPSWNPDDPPAPPRPVIAPISIDRSLYADLPTKEEREKAYQLAYNRAYHKARKAAGWKTNDRTRAADQRYYQRNRQKCLAAADARRRRELKWTAFCQQLRKQGVTLDQYHARAEAQDFLCRICGHETPLTIDHDHATGAIRGLLCGLCNDGLGKFKDHPERLLAAVAYLESQRT